MSAIQNSQSMQVVKVARLQSEFCTKDFFRATNFLTKNAPKFSPKCLSLCSVGQKKSQKIPSKFPTKFSKFPCEKSKKKSPTSFCRSAGRSSCVVAVHPCSRASLQTTSQPSGLYELSASQSREKPRIFTRAGGFKCLMNQPFFPRLDCRERYWRLGLGPLGRLLQ